MPREYDGHVKNLTANTDEPAFDEKTFRLKMNWDDSETSALGVKVEVGQFDRKGSPAEIISDLPSDSETALFTGRTEAEILDRTQFPEGTGLIVDVDSDDSVRNNFQDFKRSTNGDFSKNDTFNLTVNYDWSTPDGDNFSLIVGYLDYDYEDLCDCDSTAAPLFKLELGEDYKQYSAELRWLSPQGGLWEHIGGAYVQRTDLHFFDKLVQDSPTVVQLLNAADLQDMGQRGDFDPDPISLQPEERAGFGDAGNAVANITAPRDFFSKSDIFSVFLQSTRSISERLRLTLGGRLTYEKKDGQRSLDFADLNGNSLPIGEVDTVSAISFAAERHNLKGKREEVQFSPLINIQWEIGDDAMSYLTLTRGFKAGGFDARSNASPSAELTPANPGAVQANRTSLVGTFEYDEEIATSFELGIKMGLLDGAAELNMALFYTLYEDLQISIFDGTLGFNVGNAKEAVTAGLELDGRLQLTDYWHVGGALALLDFEFTDFENGQCRQGETPTSDNGINCDYTGDTNQYVADYSGTLLTGFIAPIGENLGIGAQLDIVFSGDYNPSSNVDPRVEQDAFYTVNARIGIGDIDKDWEVALIGKNIADEMVLTYIADTPLAYTIFGATTHTGFVAPPFTLGVQATYRW